MSAHRRRRPAPIHIEGVDTPEGRRAIARARRVLPEPVTDRARRHFEDHRLDVLEHQLGEIPTGFDEELVR